MGCLEKWGGVKEVKRGFVTFVGFIWSLWESVLVSPIAYLKLTKPTKVTEGALEDGQRGTGRPGHEKTASDWETVGKSWEIATPPSIYI
jgi:hypothetical protein